MMEPIVSPKGDYFTPACQRDTHRLRVIGRRSLRKKKLQKARRFAFDKAILAKIPVLGFQMQEA
jgi:hypothetical protein